MICSNLNIRLNTRKEIIKIKEIISKGERFIIIRDQQNKEHKFYRVDFYISGSGWHAISVGSEISVCIRESVQRLAISLIKEIKIAPVWDNIPIPGYLWACECCKKRGTVSCEEGINPSVYIKEIYANHEKVSPKCGSSKVRIFSHNFVEQTEVAKIIAFKNIVNQVDKKI